MEIQNRYPRVANYLTTNITFAQWSRAHFSGNRYNIMTNGCAESINNALREARAYPVIALLDAVQELTSSWFHDRRKAASSCTTSLTPTIETMLRERFILAQHMTATPLNQFEYNVRGNKLDSVVDLSQKSCGCRAFDIDRIPCAHALSAIGDDDFDQVSRFCSRLYTVDSWALAYAETIYPVPLASEWDIPEDTEFIKVVPPIVKKKRGPVKKQRIPSVGENRRKIVRRNKCAICREMGHYQKNCPQRQPPSDLNTAG